VVLDLPGEIVAEPVGQLDLIERVLIEGQLAIGHPRPRHLQLIENPEFHMPIPSRVSARSCRQAPGSTSMAGCMTIRRCSGRRAARLLAMTNILDGMKKATSFSRSALNARFDRRRCSFDA